MTTGIKTERDAISNLQRYLRELSYSETAQNPVDGIFDTATRDALTDFQRAAGLPATGIADKRTWDTLFEEYLEATELSRGRKGLYFFPQTPVGYEVAPGDTLTLVRIIQLLLLELKVTYDIFEDVVESGTYDVATEQAIRDFQRINRLPETGRVDERTWNRIVREYGNLYIR